MADAVIEGRGLERRFGPVRALGPLDLAVRPCESLAIFGPNGAGKTTLLQILSGILLPSRGELAIFGEPSRGAAVRRRIGVVGHGSFLYGELTARENLEFYAELFGVACAKERTREMLAEVGLSDWAERPVRTFSRGMEQRLGLARAFLHDPDLLLLDEPYSGLDPHAVAHLAEILGRVHRAGKTIVLTTHDIERGLEVCDQAAILHRGQVVWHSGRFVPAAHEMARIYEYQVGERGAA